MTLAFDQDWRRRWNIKVGDMVARHGKPELPATLVEALRLIISFDHAAVFGYPPERRPVFLFDSFRSDEQRSSVTPYLRGTYLSDPFFEACQRAVAPGLYRMEQLLPDHVRNASGVHLGYVSPCVSDKPGVLSEEIGIFAATHNGAYLVLSLMRDAERPPFSETEMDVLREIEPLVRHLLASHWPRLGVAESEFSESSARLADRIEVEVESFGSGTLTAREAEVVRLLLRGRSSGAIAEALGISAATVKIHRRNIYAKLNIASQGELFAALLDRLSEHDAGFP
jgi:DNA-binding CsgD family transcriptional regulator